MTAHLATPLDFPAFAAPYAPDDDGLVADLLGRIDLDASLDGRIDLRATAYIKGIRQAATGIGGVEDFLREYGLSTREGLALMVLAEALLRVPDALTQDKLIEDKLKEGGWSTHQAHGDRWLVSTSAWALGMTARVILPGETPEGVVGGMVRRLGVPTVRAATRQAMRFLGHHFVLGETIGDALGRARSNEAKGYRHSFDMLGEGARTRADARRYHASYAGAIEAIGKASGKSSLPGRMGISVKLSALHPRYVATHRDEVLDELVPDLLDLAQRAKAYDLNFTVDAEEADRLELSLDVIDRVAADPSLAGWDGFGLAVQAYQKRALGVVEHVEVLCRRLDRRMMVRLVKGAYWDTEVKRAQERGLSGYPVFTRKAATDASYLAVARRLLAARPRLFPQFATHNALTVATIIEMAGGDTSGFEFQRLHGMGESLYRQVTERGERIACRIYAPVGGYRDLLAYLVRRLLENGANSSFVSVVGDPDVPIEDLLVRPSRRLNDGKGYRHPNIPLPKDLYGTRKNSSGVEFGDREALAGLLQQIASAPAPEAAMPLAPGLQPSGTPEPILSPVDCKPVGKATFATADEARQAVGIAAAGFRKWSRIPVATRSGILEKAADLIEENRGPLMALLAREAGKTLDDALGEIREAADFCRYYAAEARRQFGEPMAMPGPTGEADRLHHRGRGVFIAVSPWNFPLAIFLGQAAAALAAGNAVVAKPAEQTPLVACLAVRLLHKAGIPENALLCLPGDGSVGAALTADPRIAGVVFTGSTETARAISRTLAARDGPIVPLIAETGGINAMVVDGTALPEQVADDVVMSAFRSAGQRCSALRILYLQEEIAGPVLAMIEGAARELKLGDPALPDTDVGPIIDETQRRMLTDYAGSIREKRQLRYSGDIPGEGLFFAPHIVELDRPEELTREIFGPVLHVVRWKARDLDKVIAAIAATGYGLTLGIHTRIEATVTKIVDALDTGNVYVNRNMIGAVVGTQPFGGSGLSGTGPKAGGPAYLSRFAIEQSVSVNTAAAGGNASLIAMGE